MASQLLVGIFPSSDVASLETALGNVPGLDRSRLSVLTASEKTQAHEDSFLNFMHVAEEVEQEPSLADFDEPEVFPHYLGSLPIPGDEAENFDEAIAEGRAVVVYPVSSET